MTSIAKNVRDILESKEICTCNCETCPLYLQQRIEYWTPENGTGVTSCLATLAIRAPRPDIKHRNREEIIAWNTTFIPSEPK